MFRFEKLDVWRKSVELADSVYSMTCAFSDDEKFGLSSQMRRAAVSTSSNLAEGSGRSSNKDFAHFVEISHGSLMEVISQAQIAFRLSFIQQPIRDELYGRAEELARMLSGLRASLFRQSKTKR